jgi:hypothetical protein
MEFCAEFNEAVIKIRMSVIIGYYVWISVRLENVYDMPQQLSLNGIISVMRV